MQARGKLGVTAFRAAVPALMTAGVAWAQVNAAATGAAAGSAAAFSGAPGQNVPMTAGQNDTQPMRAELASLRSAARAQIREVLTAEQQAQVDGLNVLNGPPGPSGARHAWGRWADHGPPAGATAAA